MSGVAQGPRKSDDELPVGNPPEVSVFIHHTRKCSWCAIPSVCTQIYYLLNAFQSAKQVCCSRHSMAALQPALSWDFLHHVTESTQITVLTIWAAVKIRMSCAEHHVEEPSPARWTCPVIYISKLEQTLTQAGRPSDGERRRSSFARPQEASAPAKRRPSQVREERIITSFQLT